MCTHIVIKYHGTVNLPALFSLFLPWYLWLSVSESKDQDLTWSICTCLFFDIINACDGLFANCIWICWDILSKSHMMSHDGSLPNPAQPPSIRTRIPSQVILCANLHANYKVRAHSVMIFQRKDNVTKHKQNE